MGLVCKCCKTARLIKIKPGTSAEWDKPNRVDFYFTMFSPQEERGGHEARRWGTQWLFWVCPEETVGDLWAWKGDQPWDFFGGNDAKAETPVLLATSCEELTHWKRLWCWEGLGAGEGDDRGWDGWMASLTRWTWVWVNSGSWWWTGRPGMLRFMGSQRVGHDWATDLIWSDLKSAIFIRKCICCCNFF